MSDFVVHTPEQLAAHDAATSKRYLDALREVQAKIAALEKDAARYRFLKATMWNIATVPSHNNPEAHWSVSFYSRYGTSLNENDSDRAIDAAMKGGA